MRTTLNDALLSRIPHSLNIAPTDPRVITYINSAQQRLLSKGKWWGSNQKYSVSVTNQLFTLPPQFATIELITVALRPVTLRNQWYEFLQNGWGVVNDPSATNTNPILGDQVLFRGNYPMNGNITSGNNARLVCDVLADVGAKVLVLGYDANNNWVRTLQGAAIQDGELVSLSQSPGTSSVTAWGRITDIQKPITVGQIWIYDGPSTTILANYGYWETRPQYPRYLLPLIPSLSNPTQIDLIGKMAFIPVVNPTDYLIIGNLEALRLACMSVRLEEEYNWEQAALFMNGGATKGGVKIDGAITLLNEELDHYLGSGTVQPMTMVNADFQQGVSALL